MNDSQYVMPLDDDDAFTVLTATQRLQEVADALKPHFIVFRVDHGEGIGVLPRVMGVVPPISGIGGTVCVRADVWNAFNKYWDTTYSGDYSFLRQLFGSCTPAWLDETLVKCIRVSKGAS